MFFLLKIFLIFISFYHILNTFLIFGIFDGHYQSIFSVFKDFIWVCFFLILVVTNFKHFWIHLKKVWALYILFFMLIWRGILISLLNWKSNFDMIVWFKYWIYFLFILISSIFIGYLAQIAKKDKEIYSFYKFLFSVLIFILIFSVVWQFLKFIMPWFFYKIWYWSIWDYVNGQNPPIYYRTGKWWMPRFSGLFAGPNNYWFFLVSYFSFFIINIFKDWLDKIQKSFGKLSKLLTYVLSLIFILSRGAVLWVWVQVLIFSQKFWHKINKKVFYTIISLWLIWVVWLSIWKWPSTLLHLQSTQKAFEFFTNNPIGYGLWTSWPAVHFGGTILPENIYLQVLIDIWIVWFLIWIWIFVLLYLYFQKISQNTKNKENDLFVYLKYFFYGLFWLMIEWLFLHVFEDSMVNYLFFIPFGILIWYLLFKKSL